MLFCGQVGNSEVILYSAVATVADICELSQFAFICGSGHTMSKYLFIYLFFHYFFFSSVIWTNMTVVARHVFLYFQQQSLAV